MKNSCVILCSTVAIIISACAKKKEPPPRGTVMGEVTISSELADTLKQETGFIASAHCVEMVELAEDKRHVIEIGLGQCPADKQLMEAVVETIEVQKIPERSKRESTERRYLFLQNVPVGIVKISKEMPKEKPEQPTPAPAPEEPIRGKLGLVDESADSMDAAAEKEEAAPLLLEDLCSLEAHLRNNCEVIANDQGNLERIYVNQSAVLEQMQEKQKKLDELSARLNESVTELKNLIGTDDNAGLRRTVKEMQESLSNLEKEIGNRVDGLLKTAIQDMQAIIGKDDESTGLRQNLKAMREALSSLEKEIGKNGVDERLKKVIQDIQSFIGKNETEEGLKKTVKEMQGKLSALEGKIEKIVDEEVKNAVKEMHDFIGRDDTQGLQKALKDMQAILDKVQTPSEEEQKGNAAPDSGTTKAPLLQ